MNEINKLMNGQSWHDTDQLLHLLYWELRQMAASKLSNERPGQTLQATALVHEAYLRLVGDQTKWNDRAHFFGAAAEAMRRILIEQARRKETQKRGGKAERIDLEIAAPATEVADDDLLALNDALAEFGMVDPKKAELVKLRFFAGCTLEEAASILNISRATAVRHWNYARAWLGDKIGEDKRTRLDNAE